MANVSEAPPVHDRQVRRWTDNTVVAWLVHRSGILLVLVATIVATVVPIVFLFQLAFEDGGSGIRQLLALDSFWPVVGTTVAMGAGSVAVALVIGTALAWFAHCLPPRLRFLGYIPLLPLVLPSLSLVLGYIFLLSPRVGFLNAAIRWALPFINQEEGPWDVYSLPWMIIVFGTSLAAFVFLFIRSSLMQMNQEVIDAAATAGASPFGVFWRVVLPLLRPGLVYASLTVGLLALGQFIVPLLLGRSVGIRLLTTEMYTILSGYPTNFPLAAAYGLPILIVGLMFLALQRVLLRNQDKYVTQSSRGGRPLATNGWFAQTCLVLYGIAAVLLPLGALVIVSLQEYWSRDLSNLSFNNYITVLFERDDLVSAIVNSLVYAAATVLIAIPIGYACAYVIYRRRKFPVLANIQDISVSLPLGIPAIILGTGFLLAYTVGPLRVYGTPWALILVYVTMMVPFATRLQLVAMTNLGQDLANAASVNGAGALRRLFLIDVPLLRPTLGAAAALIVVMTTHEFAASVLVRSQDTQVMGTVLYDLYTYGSYPLAAVMAILMVAVTGLGAALAFLIGGKSALRKLDEN